MSQRIRIGKIQIPQSSRAAPRQKVRRGVILIEGHFGVAMQASKTPQLMRMTIDHRIRLAVVALSDKLNPVTALKGAVPPILYIERYLLSPPKKPQASRTDAA